MDHGSSQQPFEPYHYSGAGVGPPPRYIDQCRECGDSLLTSTKRGQTPFTDTFSELNVRTAILRASIQMATTPYSSTCSPPRKPNTLIKRFGLFLMPNHFHLVVQPATEEALSPFMESCMTSHVRRYHHHDRNHGHVSQSRLKSFPIQRDVISS